MEDLQYHWPYMLGLNILESLSSFVPGCSRSEFSVEATEDLNSMDRSGCETARPYTLCLRCSGCRGMRTQKTMSLSRSTCFLSAEHYDHDGGQDRVLRCNVVLSLKTEGVEHSQAEFSLIAGSNLT